MKFKTVFKKIKFIVILSLIFICYGQEVILRPRIDLEQTLAKILLTRDPNKFQQNKAQTLTLVNIGPQPWKEQIINNVLDRVSPTLTYAFNLINEEGLHDFRPENYLSQVMIVFLDELEVKQQLRNVFRETGWLRQQHIILCITSVSKSINERLLDYTNDWFSKQKIFNMVIVYRQQLNSFDKISTFVSEPFLLAGPINRTDFSTYQDLFYDKTVDLKGHKLLIAQREDATRSMLKGDKVLGLDGHHMETILEKINAKHTVHFTADPAKKLSSNQKRLEYDMTFSMLPSSTALSTEHLSHSYMYEMEQLCFVLLHAPRQFFASEIMETFELDVWIALIIVFTVYTIIWHTYRLLQTFYVDETVSIFDTLFFMYRLHFLSSTMWQPRNRFEWIFIYNYIIYSFIIRTIFQAHLIALMILPDIDDTLETIDEVLLEKSPIFTADSVYECLKIMYGETFMEPFQTYKPGRFDFDTPAAYLMRKWEAQVILGKRQNHYRNGDQKWYMVEECLYSTPQTYLLAAGSPYKAIIDKYMLYLRETGVYQYWEREDNWPIDVKPLYFEEESYGLSLEQFQVSFYFVAIGHTVCCFVLIFEIVKKRVTAYLDRRRRVNDVQHLGFYIE